MPWLDLDEADNVSFEVTEWHFFVNFRQISLETGTPYCRRRVQGRA